MLRFEGLGYSLGIFSDREELLEGLEWLRLVLPLGVAAVVVAPVVDVWPCALGA